MLCNAHGYIHEGFLHIFNKHTLVVNHTYDSTQYSHTVKIYLHPLICPPFDWWLGLKLSCFNLKCIVQTVLKVWIPLIRLRKCLRQIPVDCISYSIYRKVRVPPCMTAFCTFKCVTDFHSSNAKIIQPATGNKRSHGSNWAHLLGLQGVFYELFAYMNG